MYKLEEMPSDEFWTQYDNHDCHLQEDDGCAVCEEATRREQEEAPPTL